MIRIFRTYTIVSSHQMQRLIIVSDEQEIIANVQKRDSDFVCVDLQLGDLDYLLLGRAVDESFVNNVTLEKVRHAQLSSMGRAWLGCCCVCIVDIILCDIV